MRVLLDTNLLTRLANPARRDMHDLAEAAIEGIRIGGHVSCLLPQSIYEFWAVATRPLDANGLDMSPGEAREEVDSMLSLFPLLQDERAIFFRWLDLVTAHEVRGKPAHDARLVAAMLRHGLSCLLTFNTSDFARYSEVTAIHPEEAIAGTAPPLTTGESAGEQG
jgi:predicted nucleic acid-binding protein